MTSTTLRTLVRHEGEVPRERSTCGWRDRLISREDTGVAAWRMPWTSTVLGSTTTNALPSCTTSWREKGLSCSMASSR